MIDQHHHKKQHKGQLQDHQSTTRSRPRPSPLFLNLLFLFLLLDHLFLLLACHIEIPTHILQALLFLLPHLLINPMQPHKATKVLLSLIIHLCLQSNWQTNYNATAIRQYFMQCEQSTCRGGLNCCNYDQSLGAYCVTDTYCNSVPPLWETIFIPIFLFAATIGILIVIYYKYRKLKPRLFTLADFVEREVRLEPMERNQQTKFKTIASFE